jgi:hypothetical protein
LCYILSSLFAKRLWTEILEELHLFLNSPRTMFLKRVCHFFKKLCSAFEEGATDLN